MSMKGVRAKMRARMNRHITELSTAFNVQPETITNAAMYSAQDRRRELHRKLDHILDSLAAQIERYKESA